MVVSPTFRESLQRRIVAIQSSIQRAVVFSELISGQDSVTASTVFQEICIAPAKTKRPSAIVLAESAFLSLVNENWPVEHCQHTREAAAYAGEEVTLAFLCVPTAVDVADENAQIPTYANDRVLTLGERKSIASMPSRNTIEKAMMDPHPDVAKKLLDNPRLTENDVVRISAKATMAPSVLCQIAAHPKWRRQRTVQRALVNNKLLPPSFALTLVPFLNQKSIREISYDKRLHIDVQNGAKVLIAAISHR